ncbi:hypothetical protein D7X94_08985 [Acutalibacter sp. 1XD8-33]|uniref:cell division protein ZapA n=1 Tax=Acutalibacter sp. 1XD8-33 TaxID=2320081 RepID=UPI000EA0150D|nr:cell division protein ZapA [Acutalibacter sp. 1XD8-33]RKJ40261.1 hypothetical protein D7X94_08985 [Acutalibacter sp. 1XD8-33]
MEKRRVRLTINGVVCGLITGESEAYMQSLADEVGDLMRQIMTASPFITREAAALTAALSLCDDAHKNGDRAAALAEKNEELEVEAELWKEEKVELLKSAVDTQKDAQLAEKAARLESENALLEEAVARLKGIEQRSQALEDENAALREAAQAPSPSPKVAALTEENRQLQDKLVRLAQAGQTAQTENQRLQQELALLNDSLRQAREALRQSQEAQAAQAASSKPPQPGPGAPRAESGKRRRKNPLRYEENLEQEGMVSFFKQDDE